MPTYIIQFQGNGMGVGGVNQKSNLSLVRSGANQMHCTCKPRVRIPTPVQNLRKFLGNMRFRNYIWYNVVANLSIQLSSFAHCLGWGTQPAFVSASNKGLHQMLWKSPIRSNEHNHDFARAEKNFM